MFHYVIIINATIDTVDTRFAGAVQHQRLAGQEQGSHPGVRCAAHAGVQGTARCLFLQGPGRRLVAPSQVKTHLLTSN